MMRAIDSGARCDDAEKQYNAPAILFGEELRDLVLQLGRRDGYQREKRANGRYDTADGSFRLNAFDHLISDVDVYN